MYLANTTPILPGETIMSWVGRIARNELEMGPFEFLNFFGLNRKEVVEATPSGLDRLVEISGAERSALRAAAYVPVSDRYYEFRGERFHAEFAGRGRTTFCPACLLEDSQPGSPSSGARIGRVSWLFEPIRTCRRHGLPLVRVKNSHYAEAFQDMNLVAPDDARLQELVAGSLVRDPSPLQTYVEARLDGQGGPAWLDGQQIDHAARATEMIGVCLTAGPHANLDLLTHDDWDKAGAAGFAYTSRGKEGVGEVLTGLFNAALEAGCRGGAQAVFGRLYQSCRDNDSRKSRGPIEGVLREFVLDHMYVAPGTRLIGEIVKRSRRHSVASLAKLSGLHPKTVCRALVLTDMIVADTPDHAPVLATTDAERGERLMADIKAAAPINALPTHLNCRRTQAEALVKNGLLRRLGDNSRYTPQELGVLNNVPLAEIDRFLADFRSHGTEVSQPTDGMVDVIAAAEIVRRPVIEIVRLVLDGGLTKIELLAADRKFRSVLVWPAEVKQVLTTTGKRDRLSLGEAAECLKISVAALTVLSRTLGDDGRPLVTISVETPPDGTARGFVDLTEIVRFQATFVRLVDLAAERNIAVSKLTKQIKATGTPPVLPQNQLGQYVFRRDRLPD